MTRKVTFNRLVSELAREAARQEKKQRQQNNARKSELERLQKESTRIQKQVKKEEKQLYLKTRLKEADEINSQLQERILKLSKILEFTFEIDDSISFDILRIHENFRPFFLPIEYEKPVPEPLEDSFLNNVKRPSSIGKLLPGVQKRYESEIQLAKRNYWAAFEKYKKECLERESIIQKYKDEYEKERQAFHFKVLQRNQEIDTFEKAYIEGDQSAICAYCTMVLDQSAYPEEFPQEFRIAYLPDSKELIVEYELPNVNVIPKVTSYRYIKTRDTLDEKLRNSAEIKNLYQDIVASICLRTIHELFEADQYDHLQIIVFNGFVKAIDPATGHDIRPCLISIRTIKDRFNEIKLDKIDKKACLRNLGAQISPQASELQPVKPVIEFDMVDKRFVEKSDLLSDIESRPNLMDLNPFEFENFISNLFDIIGFEAKLTRSAKDGGIDVIAFDPRPILGGKVVIQAKRYKNVVGVSAVRDLYGTMINEGASKGILVTTSHYGPDAYDFSKDKPIELIDGGGLLYLLKQQGIEARIVFPDDSKE